MIIIPYPFYLAIAIVLSIGVIAGLNKYIKLVSFILYLGFYFSFDTVDKLSYISAIYDNIKSMAYDDAVLIIKLAIPLIAFIVFISYVRKS